MSVADRPRQAVRVMSEEATEQQGVRAGVVSRTLAMVIDAVVAVALVAGGYAVWAGLRLLRAPRRFTWPSPSFTVLVTAALVVAAIALTVSWASTGRSTGARVMGLRVLGPDGEPPRLWRAFLRAVTCVAFPIGLYWSAVSRRNASVQDLVFRTSVVYDWHQR
jgi:uncharacterized RDD family membrane protein YckC